MAPKLFPNTPVEVLYCPVSLGAEPRAEVPGRIVQIGRIEFPKGHRVLLEALGMMKQDPNWTCWIVGGAQNSQENSYLADLIDRAEKLGIGSRVEFLGQQSTVAPILSSASIFCQPNTGNEAFGIAMVEALAAGVPVVASNIGGAPEIIDPTCGLLTAPGDPKELAAALRLLLSNPVRRGALGAAGPRRAAALSNPAQQLQALAKLVRTVKLEGRAA